MSNLLVIPARYDSSRFPGKPLALFEDSNGKKISLIEKTWQLALKLNSFDKKIIATDDIRIKDFCEGFGAEVCMTSNDLRNGSERVAETLNLQDKSYKVIVNLQGDAPLTPIWVIEGLVKELEKSNYEVATPVLKCDQGTLNKLISDKKAGRIGATTVVFDKNQKALYFSKELIPHTNQKNLKKNLSSVYHHIGVYAYKSDALKAYIKFPQGNLEKQEGLEQLRFVENDISIKCVISTLRGNEFWELNNPSDIPIIEKILKKMIKFSYAACISSSVVRIE